MRRREPDIPRNYSMEKVRLCIVNQFTRDSVITPSRIRLASKNQIDYYTAKACLEALAPVPGERIGLEGAHSDLIRSTAILRPHEWWYDQPEDKFFPLFPWLHELTAKTAPLLHEIVFHGLIFPRQ